MYWYREMIVENDICETFNVVSPGTPGKSLLKVVVNTTTNARICNSQRTARFQNYQSEILDFTDYEFKYANPLDFITSGKRVSSKKINERNCLMLSPVNE
jgi:hypothetical protein